ncbi:PucR family transcriptional regulator ligand-binding domain-containing protein [Amphritea sp. 1_MG-2023]|uniref:PucR family transcriptional regulator n=1 Tax=Amphritea sp. 1_MG-2023 TaxID=3062670 RepID=UPI0026E230D4|nr:PucR family transcriptional regulator [Amphritea sp. 1_MG-2023]MDO6562413.1 PucR family transcriptional regulator ligand-binding domain-containing protein [Amphritea sp. 1_MG-2023]
MSIICADVSRLPGLEAINMVAGLRGSQHAVRWPYVAEDETLGSWLRGGELIFVTGINKRRSEDNLQRLIREAVEYGAAGIVILTGSEFIQSIPSSVKALANALGFALFEQPYSLPMVQVTEVICNAIVQDNLIGQSTRLFLTRLINGYADTPELIHLRAADLGLSDTRPYAVLAVRLKGFNQRLRDDPAEQWKLIHQRSLLEDKLTELLKRRGIDWPVLEYEQDLLAIWPTDAQHSPALSGEIMQALEYLPAELEVYAGISDLQPGLSSIAKASEQARHAVQFALQQEQKMFCYDQLGIARLFDAIPQRSLLSQFCQQQLGALCFARDQRSLMLKETLTHFLNYFGNQQQAADCLSIHRNTLSHRLKRIEQLIDCPLNDPFARLNLQSALLIEQILFQHHNIESQSENHDGNS